MVEKQYITYHIPDASGGVNMRELFNENHDPETGQFIEGDGGSGGGSGGSTGGSLGSGSGEGNNIITARPSPGENKPDWLQKKEKEVPERYERIRQKRQVELDQARDAGIENIRTRANDYKWSKEKTDSEISAWNKNMDAKQAELNDISSLNSAIQKDYDELKRKYPNYYIGGKYYKGG